MDTKTNDGGPAFPITSSTGDPRDGTYCQNGMSLRDYFAAAALQGDMSAESEGFVTIGRGERTREQILAESAYKVADAMLKARGQ